MQNKIELLLSNHPLIPVVEVEDEYNLHIIFERLRSKNISIIEITLRNEFAWNAIEMAKAQYGNEFKIGVGTIISADQVQKCIDLKVDFMVCPGLTTPLIQILDFSGIPFLVGATTPSEIMRGIEIGWNVFKFFPAEQFGGVSTLKTYEGIFKQVTFCPTGGIDSTKCDDYLKLNNVISVGGSWLVK
jgi:2-dehydro-3-deoxyphosphogluconate aldolase/(4S)-4-hydroxy-2-oxoglutarate aldolase